MTKSMEGRDRTVRSDKMSIGAAAGIIGYTVKRHPQPFTEPSLENFHLSSSPLILNSWDQSDHSRPDEAKTSFYNLTRSMTHVTWKYFFGINEKVANEKIRIYCNPKNRQMGGRHQFI